MIPNIKTRKPRTPKSKLILTINPKITEILIENPETRISEGKLSAKYDFETERININLSSYNSITLENMKTLIQALTIIHKEASLLEKIETIVRTKSEIKVNL